MTFHPNGLANISLSASSNTTTAQATERVAYFNVTTSWQGGFRSKSTCDPFVMDGKSEPATCHSIYADEPQLLGGKGSAPNPQELMLAAFNSCLTAAYVTAAVEENVTLAKLQIQTCGTLDLQGVLDRSGQSHSNAESIHYLITVSGSGSSAQFERIHQRVIATSPNRWLIGRNMLIEGDQVVESE